MLGLLVELAISWLLLRLLARRNLTALGITPRKSRLREVLLGLLAAGLVCSIYHVATVYGAGNGWHRNPTYASSTMVKSAYWTWKSVLFETFIFQGALLYLAIRKLGITKACGLSALCFGVYHWFSYGAFGNPVLMGFILLTTGITGLMYAFAFAQTESVYLPIGLHLGWNLVNIVVFSKGPLGAQLLLPDTTAKLHGAAWLLGLLFQVLVLPVLVYTYLHYAKRCSCTKV